MSINNVQIPKSAEVDVKRKLAIVDSEDLWMFDIQAGYFDESFIMYQ